MSDVTEKEDRLAGAKEQGQAQFDSIREMVDELRSIAAALEDTESDALIDAQDAARQRIEENALSVEVRSGWVEPDAFSDTDGHERRRRGKTVVKASEYRILLCTGGPAVQIVGDLSEHGEPESARLEVRDWFQPWTVMRPQVAPDNFDSEPILLEYARCFYFGE